jgi:energy-coupling factor transporter transmembrane protein EcfT
MGSPTPASHAPGRAPATPAGDKPVHRIRPLFTWFAVLGGVVAWAIHLLVAWAVMEVSCFVRRPGYVLQHGGSPTHAEYAVTIGATVLPWLVALMSLIACLRLRVLVGRLDDDELAKGRLHLLVIMGLFFDVMMLAAITGGGIALYVLEPC